MGGQANTVDHLTVINTKDGCAHSIHPERLAPRVFKEMAVAVNGRISERRLFEDLRTVRPHKKFRNLTIPWHFIKNTA